MKQWILLTAFLITLTACVYEETPVQSSQVITDISSTPNNPVADGKSPVRIAVTLPVGTVDGKENVLLQTSDGIFAESEKNNVIVPATFYTTTDKAKIAYATLISPATEGQVQITVTVQKFTKDYILSFSRAFPETIRLTTDRQYVKAAPDSEAILTVALIRTKGTPTAGQAITLTVTDDLNQPTTVGSFRNKTLVSDATGKIINYFSINDLSQVGKKFKILAKTKDANGLDLNSEPIVLNVLTP